MASRILALALVVSSLAHAAAGKYTLAKGFGPSIEVTKSRAPHVFNAVNNAMRQWGSSLHHNGMSFYLATVPEGVLFHHGNNNNSSPKGPEWLAYEIEHAEIFARRGRPRGGNDDEEALSGQSGSRNMYDAVETSEHQHSQHTMAIGTPGDLSAYRENVEGQGGWLHTYRTTRQLRYLYVDGMSGGKTAMGTLDSQDDLLRAMPHLDKQDSGPMGERERASELCEMCYYWDLSGVIRMEAGSEIIHCDFQDGLEHIQALQRPDPAIGGRESRGLVGSFEYFRTLSERYYGIGSSRTTVDFSSMVSAFFYPVNITNPDPKRPDLPRLSNSSRTELAAIKSDLTRVIHERNNGSAAGTVIVDWQGVTDLVVTRYADRLKYMAEKATSAKELLDVINHLLTDHIDYSGRETEQIPAAIERCSNFYLHGLRTQTEADHLIYAAIKSVTAEICTKLFDARKILTTKPADTTTVDPASLSDALQPVRSLVEYLGWARFKRCSQCEVDEVCMIPMWPFGTKEDYESPRCANSSNIRGDGESYWGRLGMPGQSW